MSSQNKLRPSNRTLPGHGRKTQKNRNNERSGLHKREMSLDPRIQRRILEQISHPNEAAAIRANMTNQQQSSARVAMLRQQSPPIHVVRGRNIRSREAYIRKMAEQVKNKDRRIEEERIKRKEQSINEQIEWQKYITNKAEANRQRRATRNRKNKSFFSCFGCGNQNK